MNQTKTVLTAIVEFLLGKKYYANIINTRGTDQCQICSYIFLSPQSAERHRNNLEGTVSYQYIETVSFRSRKDYSTFAKSQNL